MTLVVRDLMMDVFPAQEPSAPIACEVAGPALPRGYPKKPLPKPKPKPKPQCTDATAWGGPEGSCDLAALAVLREQLHRALRS